MLVALGIDWLSEGRHDSQRERERERERGIGKDVDGESSFTIILRLHSQNQ